MRQSRTVHWRKDPSFAIGTADGPGPAAAERQLDLQTPFAQPTPDGLVAGSAELW